MVIGLELISLVQTPALLFKKKREISVPLRNGRFLSPNYERQREGERPSKIEKNVDAHH